MLHNTTKLRKISGFYAEFFHIKSPNESIVYVTYLRWLVYWNMNEEWTENSDYKNLEFEKALREDSFLRLSQQSLESEPTKLKEKHEAWK